MQKKEINTAVKNIFKELDRLLHKIVTDFKTEEVQKFRKEIKRLTGFFHLLDMEENGMIQFKLPRKMKTFYGYLGFIRDIQVHLKNINSYCENSSENIPVSYITKLEKELENWKKKAKKYVDRQNNFFNDENKIVAVLPNELHETPIQKFLDYVIYELRELLSHSDDDDETLHSIREFLEDIVYNLVLLEPYTRLLAKGLSHQDGIKSLIEIFEIFRDKCRDIALLQTYCDDSSEHDDIILQKILHTWKIQKHELNRIIYDLLDLMQCRDKKDARVFTSKPYHQAKHNQ